MRLRRNGFASRWAMGLVSLALVAAACVGGGGGTNNEDTEPRGDTGEAIEPRVAQEPTEPTTIRYYVFSSVAESEQMPGFKEEFEQEYP
ncbi:MAG TPA: hypothetical protein VEC09_08575, partial [Actinomycetota bacterium]|nr:hypothetical protein [Actinomycetota bacterium]